MKRRVAFSSIAGLLLVALVLLVFRSGLPTGVSALDKETPPSEPASERAVARSSIGTLPSDSASERPEDRIVHRPKGTDNRVLCLCCS